MAVTTGSYAYGSVNSSTKKQVVTLYGNSTNFLGYANYWSFFQWGVGSFAYSGPYDNISGITGFYAAYPGIGDYNMSVDGATYGSLIYGVTGAPLDCDTTYQYRAGYGGADGGSPVAYRYGGTATLKTYAIDPTIPTPTLSGATSSAITADGNWTPGTSESSASLNLQYKKSSDSSWTTHASSAGTGTGYTGRAATQLTASSLDPATSYDFRYQVVRATTTNPTTTFYGATATLSTLSSAPTITTEDATALDYDRATLNGSIDPNTLSTDGTFEWGLTTGYGNTTSPASTITGDGSQSFSKGITGLASSTLYHYRSKGVYSGGTVYGSDKTFTTSAPPPDPAITTSAADTIATTSANLNGIVNPNGLSTEYYFEYGLTTGYGSVTSTQGPSTASSPFGFNAAISGLTASTLYHFRAVAVYNSTSYYGSDATFTTAASPEAKAIEEDHVLTFSGDDCPRLALRGQRREDQQGRGTVRGLHQPRVHRPGDPGRWLLARLQARPHCRRDAG
jgi:hypothetical protein